MKTEIKLLRALEAYGLNEKQAKLYLACLKHDLATVQDLSEKSGLKRTTIYSLIESLEKLDLIHVIKKKKKTYIEAQPPEILIEALGNRKEKLERALPYFEEIKKQPDHHPKFILYRGNEGFKNFWRDILHSSEKEWLIMTSGKEFLSFVSESYVVSRFIKEKKKRDIKSRQIISDSRYAREIVKKDKEENRESRIVSHKYPLASMEIVYGNKVAIISSCCENLLIVIESEDISRSHRSYFEMLWDFAGKQN